MPNKVQEALSDKLSVEENSPLEITKTNEGTIEIGWNNDLEIILDGGNAPIT